MADDQAFWDAVATVLEGVEKAHDPSDPGKHPKDHPDVNFVSQGGEGAETCGGCRYFGNGACDLVKGSIRPEDYCDLYEPASVAKQSDDTTRLTIQGQGLRVEHGGDGVSIDTPDGPHLTTSMGAGTVREFRFGKVEVESHFADGGGVGYLVKAGDHRIAYAPKFTSFPAWAEDADLLVTYAGSWRTDAHFTTEHLAVDELSKSANEFGVRRTIYLPVGKGAVRAMNTGLTPPNGEWGRDGDYWTIKRSAPARSSVRQPQSGRTPQWAIDQALAKHGQHNQADHGRGKSGRLARLKEGIKDWWREASGQEFAEIEQQNQESFRRGMLAMAMAQIDNATPREAVNAGRMAAGLAKQGVPEWAALRAVARHYAVNKETLTTGDFGGAGQAALSVRQGGLIKPGTEPTGVKRAKRKKKKYVAKHGQHNQADHAGGRGGGKGDRAAMRDELMDVIREVEALSVEDGEDVGNAAEWALASIESAIAAAGDSTSPDYGKQWLESELKHLKTVRGNLRQRLGKAWSGVAEGAPPEPLSMAYALQKSDGEKRFTFGPVYIPDSLDAHDEFTDASELQKAIWDFVRKGDRSIRLQHTARKAGEWVEIATWPYPTEVELSLPDSGTIKATQPVEKATLPPNTAFMGVIWEDWAWELVKQGRLRGYSIGGVARRVEADFDMSKMKKGVGVGYTPLFPELLSKHANHNQKDHGRRGGRLAGPSGEPGTGVEGTGYTEDDLRELASMGVSAIVTSPKGKRGKRLTLVGRKGIPKEVTERALEAADAPKPPGFLADIMARITSGGTRFVWASEGEPKSLEEVSEQFGIPVWALTKALGNSLGTDAVPFVKHPGHPDQKVHAGKRARGVKEAVDDLVARARKAEPELTKTITEVAKATGGTPEGLEFRLKEPESLTRKIADRWLATGGATSVKDIAAGISDSVRYTVTWDDSDYTAGAEGALKALEDQGFKAVKVKNYWEPGDSYDGINAVVENADGLQVEVQFHTKKSWDVKMESHEIYQVARTTEDKDKVAALTTQMVQLWASVPRPKGVKAVGDLITATVD